MTHQWAVANITNDSCSRHRTEDTRRKFNDQIVEQVFAKLVPAAGRNAKGPEQLIEVMRPLLETLTVLECLTREMHEALILEKVAFQDL